MESRVDFQAWPSASGLVILRRWSSISWRNQVERPTDDPASPHLRMNWLRAGWTWTRHLAGAPQSWVFQWGRRSQVRVGLEVDEVGVGVDADGVVAAGFEFIEGEVPVFVAGAGPAAFEPGEVPHGDGEGVGGDVAFEGARGCGGLGGEGEGGG
jgi:hypothetical protein